MLKALYADMHVYMFIYMHECADAYRGQKLTSVILLNGSPPYFMKGGLSLSGSFLIWLPTHIPVSNLNKTHWFTNLDFGVVCTIWSE